MIANLYIDIFDRNLKPKTKKMDKETILCFNRTKIQNTLLKKLFFDENDKNGLKKSPQIQ